MEKINYLNPEFLLCEIPIKDNSFNDKRVWVYSLKSLSLIEFINVDLLQDFEFKGKQERFEYISTNGTIENWFGVFTQNNCELTENNSNKILKKAWDFFEKYLKWKDSNFNKKNSQQWN